MPRPVVFRPQADAEVVEIRAWYTQRQHELGTRFGVELGNTVSLIAENPLMFQRVHGEMRRAVLRRFPYAVYFRESVESIVVLAVHGRQDPKRWKARR